MVGACGRLWEEDRLLRAEGAITASAVLVTEGTRLHPQSGGIERHRYYALDAEKVNLGQEHS